MSDRLFPSTWPSVETQTNRLEVGGALSTRIVFEPGLRGVAPVRTVVSSSDPGVGVGDERRSTAVPVLSMRCVTSPIFVGWGNWSIRPTPFLKFGNGTGSVYVSMGHAVDELPSMASPAWPGASASPSGENTVARTGFTT